MFHIPSSYIYSSVILALKKKKTFPKMILRRSCMFCGTFFCFVFCEMKFHISLLDISLLSQSEMSSKCHWNHVQFDQKQIIHSVLCSVSERKPPEEPRKFSFALLKIWINLINLNNSSTSHLAKVTLYDFTDLHVKIGFFGGGKAGKRAEWGAIIVLSRLLVFSLSLEVEIKIKTEFRLIAQPYSTRLRGVNKGFLKRNDALV